MSGKKNALGKLNLVDISRNCDPLEIDSYQMNSGGKAHNVIIQINEAGIKGSFSSKRRVLVKADSTCKCN
jgi:hypothetical protein